MTGRLSDSPLTTEKYQQWVVDANLSLQKGIVRIIIPVALIFFIVRLIVSYCWQYAVLLVGFCVASAFWVYCLRLTRQGQLLKSVKILAATIITFEGLTGVLVSGTMVSMIAADMIAIVYSSIFSRRLLIYSAIGTYFTIALSLTVEYFDFWPVKDMSPTGRYISVLFFAGLLIAVVTVVLNRSRLMQKETVASMREMYDDQQRILNAAGDISRVLESTVQQISDASGKFNTQFSQQAAAISEINDTMERIRQIAGETAASADNTSQVSNRTAQKSKDGSEQLKKMEQSFVEVVMSTDVVRFEFTDLAEKATNIGDIITAYDEIAGQIKILAVNAAIQAAKAGRYGTGFRVVANELKSMIQRTDESLSDIRRLLEYIRTQAKQSADVIERNSMLMHSQLEELNSTGALFEEITEAFYQTSEHVDKITVSAQRQQLGLDEVRFAISSIHSAVQEFQELTDGLFHNVHQISSFHDEMVGLFTAPNEDALK